MKMYICLPLSFVFLAWKQKIICSCFSENLATTFQIINLVSKQLWMFKSLLSARGRSRLKFESSNLYLLINSRGQLEAILVFFLLFSGRSCYQKIKTFFHYRPPCCTVTFIHQQLLITSGYSVLNIHLVMLVLTGSPWKRNFHFVWVCVFVLKLHWYRL